MKYPYKVHKMLKKAWALRKRLRAKKKHKKGAKVTKCNRGDRRRANASGASRTTSRRAGESRTACDKGCQ